MTLVAAIKAKIGKKAGLCAAKKNILLAMANYASEDYTLFPSYETLSDDTFCSRPTVIKHVREMVEMGLLEKRARVCDAGNKTNIYTIKIVSWLKSHGYVLEVNEAGYLVAKLVKTELQPSGDKGLSDLTRGLSCLTRGVKQLNQGGKAALPDPVIDPVIETNNNNNAHAIENFGPGLENQIAQENQIGQQKFFCHDQLTLDVDPRFRDLALKIKGDSKADIEQQFEDFCGMNAGKQYHIDKWITMWRRWDNSHISHAMRQFQNKPQPNSQGGYQKAPAANPVAVRRSYPTDGTSFG